MERKANLIEALKVVGVDGLDKLVQSGLILLGDGSEGEGSRGLLVHNSAKTSLGLEAEKTVR